MPETASAAHSEETIPGLSENDYKVVRTWSFCDDCASEVQTITVSDTTPPVLTGPDDETVESPNIPPMYEGQVTATDPCSEPPVPCTEHRVNGDCEYDYI